ncbi:hypothetical protein GGS23DRAFT_195370 [Durotheca rogersii]|uniref:uncharacterized protein n=1 Tax=Durotheca rogersii TaxID=419775 RepID=UPI002220D843|nr:uncharacterized protein GGS23DRAFT_195370 [Durotheca rogersii]KAI5867783.1 hypothetical protein GGS23DRAFT_195370 [Durotheca rogersii]
MRGLCYMLLCSILRYGIGAVCYGRYGIANGNAGRGRFYIPSHPISSHASTYLPTCLTLGTIAHPYTHALACSPDVDVSFRINMYVHRYPFTHLAPRMFVFLAFSPDRPVGEVPPQLPCDFIVLAHHPARRSPIRSSSALQLARSRERAFFFLSLASLSLSSLSLSLFSFACATRTLTSTHMTHTHIHTTRSRAEWE